MGAGASVAEYPSVAAALDAGKSQDDIDQFLSHSSSGQFVDAQFPPCEASITGVSDSATSSSTSWTRLESMCANPVLICAGGASPLRVCQSSLGDCYLLAAMSVIAERPRLVQRLFDATAHDAAAGRLCVRLFHGGKWRSCQMDSLFPSTVGAGGDATPQYAWSSDKNEAWVAAVEKAYAKLYGSYQAIAGGDTAEALRDLTGFPVVTLKLKKDKAKKDGVFDEMFQGFRTGQLLACGWTGNDKDTAEYWKRHTCRVLPNHAYSILRVAELKQPNRRFVQVRNPWGTRSSSVVVPEVPAKDLSALSDKTHAVAEGDEDDGTFWLDYAAFARCFNSVYIAVATTSDVTAAPSDGALARSQGEWIALGNGGSTGTAGGCSTFATWRRNSSWTLRVSAPCKVVLTVSQPDRRLLKRTVEDKISYPQVGIEVVTLTGDAETTFPPMLASGSSTYSVVAKSSFFNKRDVSLMVDITPKLVGRDLVVVPSTFYPNQATGKFTLTVETAATPMPASDSSAAATCTLTPRLFGAGEASSSLFVHRATVMGRWAGKSAVGFGAAQRRKLWHLPQWHLNLTDPDPTRSSTNCVLFLVARPSSKKKKQGIGEEDGDYAREYAPPPVGILIFRRTPALRNAAAAQALGTGGTMVGKASFSNPKELARGVTLRRDEGPFFILPIAMKAGVEASFVLDCVADGSFTLSPAADAIPNAAADKPAAVVKGADPTSMTTKKKKKKASTTTTTAAKKNNKMKRGGKKHRAKAAVGGKKAPKPPANMFRKAKGGMDQMAGLYANLG